MTWLQQHWLQLLFVLAYLTMVAHHAWYANKRMREQKEAPNTAQMPPWMIALSFYATFVSTNTFIGHAGKSWDVGLIWYVKGLFYLVFVVLAWYVLAPSYVLIRKQYSARTFAEVLGRRYDSPVMRRASSAVVLIASLMYLVAVYNGSALALQRFFDLNYYVSAIIIFVVVTSYVATGGFRAVVMTDVVQGSLLAVGAVVIVIGVIVKGGGLSNVLSNVEKIDPDLVSWQGKISLTSLLGLSLAGAIKIVVDPRQTERFNGLSRPKDVRWAGLLVLFLMGLTYFCLLPIGTFARVLIPHGEITTTDEVMPYLLGTSQILGPVMSSFFLLLLLAGAMSSLDSVLLVAGSTITHDLLRREGSQASTSHPTGWIVVVSVVTLLLAFNPFGDIVEITAFVGSLYGACFLCPMLVGMHWKRGTAAGAIACVTLSSVTVIGWFVLNRLGYTSRHEIYPGMVVGCLSYFAVSLATSRGQRRIEEAAIPVRA